MKDDFLWPILGFTGSTQIARGKMGKSSTSLLRVNLTHPRFMGKEGELAGAQNVFNECMRGLTRNLQLVVVGTLVVA